MYGRPAGAAAGGGGRRRPGPPRRRHAGRRRHRRRGRGREDRTASIEADVDRRARSVRPTEIRHQHRIVTHGSSTLSSASRARRTVTTIEAGVSAAGAALSSGHQSGRPRRGGCFRQIAEAYEMLERSGAAARATTRRGPSRRERRDAAAGFEGFDFSARRARPFAATFCDLFADVFQRAPRARRRRRRAAPTCTRRCTLSFDEALRGGDFRWRSRGR